MTPRDIDWSRTPFGIFFDPQFRQQGRWLFHSALIGIVAGVGAILFDLVFQVCQKYVLGGIGRFVPPAAGMEGGPGFGPQVPWLLPVALVAGGLVSGALVFGLAPEAEGHGTDAVIKAFHHLRGKIRRRVPVVKALASAITIGSGGSAGREGPIAQIGAGFGSFLGDVLKLGNRDRRILMMAGVAGGIGSIFRAPLGSAFFAAEVLYSEPEFEYEALLPGLIASITGYAIYSSYAGWGFLFNVPPIAFHRPRELIVYAGLGILCAMAGTLWPSVFYGVRDKIFRPLPIPTWTKPAAGALVLGGIAIVFPESLGMGYGYIQQAIEGARGVGFLLLFAAAKIVATSLTISSGGSGGVFGPSLVIGGALGGAFGTAAMHVVPSIAPEPVACIMVGMCGFFAGVAKTPIAAVVMVMEMTGSYGLLVPSLLVGAIAYLVLPIGIRLYENQVPSRIDSPAHTGSFVAEILRRARVREVWVGKREGLRTLVPDTPVNEVIRTAGGTPQTLFPVLDEERRLVGEITLEEVRRELVRTKPEAARRVGEIMNAKAPVLVPDDDLEAAARVLAAPGREAVVVVDDRKGKRFVGVFGRRDLILAYGTLVGAEAEPEIPG